MPPLRRHVTVSAVLACALCMMATIGVAQDRVFREIRRFDVPEARQGVAVDAEHFYAITNRAVAKYTKATGTLVKRWEASDATPLVHLNAGLVIDGKLYCAHSNYPDYPDTSSVEIWDADSLEHVGTHSFGITDGSLTWIDSHDGAWWAVFAHYSKHVGKKGRTQGTPWTRLVKLDQDWRLEQSWLFPEELIRRFEPSSNSGGMWGPDGLLYCTGHDEAELYRLTLPSSGSVLRLRDVIPVSFPGQAFAWDRSEQGIIYGVDKSSRRVVVLQSIDQENRTVPHD